MSILHTLNDGSVLGLMSARQLISISAWNGNRILDKTHKESIKVSLNGKYTLLDHGYKLISVPEIDAGGNTTEKIYIIDGQHRAEVLREAFLSDPAMDDFTVVVSLKKVTDEMEAIAYFRTLNHAKPIDWKSDPKMIVMEYIETLTKAFAMTRRTSYIREDTKFPYLSYKVLRTALEKEHERKPLSEKKQDIEQFVVRVLEWNADKITEPVPPTLSKKVQERIQRAAATTFMLAVDPSCPWIQACRVTFTV
jgi:hypothetical protein